MSNTHFSLLLLLAFAITIHRLCAQDQTGFISLDCGLRDTQGYNDRSNGLYYTTDEKYIDTGTSTIISPEFSDSVPRQYRNLRHFPDGTIRNCYTLRPIQGKSHYILLRVGFVYGNYDNQRKLPEFDLQLGVDRWETVKFQGILDIVVKEIIHIPTSDYVNLCLVNTGHGTPFISLIEMRPIDPIYNTTSGLSFKLITRWYFGTDNSGQIVRYKDNDIFDRIWSSMTIRNGSSFSTPARVIEPGPYQLPDIIVQTLASAPTVNQSLFFSIISPTNSSDDQIYTYFHFAEITPGFLGLDRSVDLYINGNLSYKSLVPAYMRAHAVSRIAFGNQKYEFTISATANAKYAPIISAFEAYSVQRFPHSETDQNDVSAINGIKRAYGIKRNWQGDPCLPEDFVWIGVNCTLNGFESPNIMSLNLSSSGLNGQIDPSISNMTMLQYLDLSNNHLTGNVPDSLSRLPLRYLNLAGNQLNGPLPVELEEKAKNGSLILSFGNQTHYKGKKPHLVPIVASIGATFGLLAVSLALWMMIKMKHRNTKDPKRVMDESKDNNASFVVPKLRRFTFSEVKNFISEGKVIGKGGFGIVYHGHIDSIAVAVKMLISSPNQELKDFQSEVNILSTVHHRCLTSILGYFNEGENKGIICEFLENGNLGEHLSGKSSSILSWELRLKILVDVAEGLQYLHHGCNPPIIHRDIKPSNILLTKDFTAKLADFGFSRPFPLESVRVVGTPGYRDPRYIHPDMLTVKIDIYSFGVVMLEVVTGRSPIISGLIHITQWVQSIIEMGDIQTIVDPCLRRNFNVNVAWRVVELAMACASHDVTSRPNMNHVVKELKECLDLTVFQQDEYGKRNSNDPSGIKPSEMGSLYTPYTR